MMFVLQLGCRIAPTGASPKTASFHDTMSLSCWRTSGNYGTVFATDRPTDRPTDRLKISCPSGWVTEW